MRCGEPIESYGIVESNRKIGLAYSGYGDYGLLRFNQDMWNIVDSLFRVVRIEGIL
jgi:hypothetical protein